jgi:hypothetical protein
MTRLDRRKLLRLLGAGWLATKTAQLAHAETAETIHPSAIDPHQPETASAPAPPALTDLAHQTAAVTVGLDEQYFWRDDHTLLFLRHIPDHTVFHAVLVDAATGQQTLPDEFNAKHSASMPGRRMIVTIQGSPKRETHYIPPVAALSPDQKWLLWRNNASNHSSWVAATLEGQQEWMHSNPKEISNHPFWMPDSLHWVELVSRYVDDHYEIPLAQEYRLGEATPVRTIDIRGLQDGLFVGLRQDGMVMLHHHRHSMREPVRQIDLSLVGLAGETAVAQSLSIPIPVAYMAMDVTLSPQGDRLAWILLQGGERPWLYTLTIADADGAHARSIATAEEVRSREYFSCPNALRWLPDGKQVSFDYNGAIHTIAV